MAVPYDPLESGFMCLPHYKLYAPLFSFCGAPFFFSPYWCLLLVGGVHVEAGTAHLSQGAHLKFWFCSGFQLRMHLSLTPKWAFTRTCLSLTALQVVASGPLRICSVRRERRDRVYNFSQIGSVCSNPGSYGMVWLSQHSHILLFSNLSELVRVRISLYSSISRSMYLLGSGAFCSLAGGPAMPPCRYGYCKPLPDPFLSR